ncbi:MAG: ribonuclease HII [Candidatus Moranbacteria bacterium CG23_combo_of_CG06-09_8_20_14_all_39_10]|nr:MAG: ribonuclease HII [Candidatus Moranbacteria bacterium CG23_combo_of_CG06-09_8_20_14_all_39_10]
MVKINSTFDLEKQLLAEGYAFVIGTDEAGRGPLAVPVIACAAIVRNDKFQISSAAADKSNSNDQTCLPVGKVSNDKTWDLVRDSKMLSAKQREKVFDFILENFYVGIGICDHKTIDEINILEASFLAMKKAVTDLKTKFRHELPNFDNNIILVDGNKKIPNLSLYQKAVIGGDRIVKSISAASIIAKVTRDRMMLEMHEKYPQYGFDKHKGYGTKMHMEALQQFGPCEIHRQTFEPMPSLAKKHKR